MTDKADGVRAVLGSDDLMAKLEHLLHDLRRRMNGSSDCAMVEHAAEISAVVRERLMDVLTLVDGLIDERDTAIAERVKLEFAFQQTAWENFETLKHEFGWSDTDARSLANGLHDLWSMAADEPQLFRPLLQRFVDEMPRVTIKVDDDE
jgi:hypothetical protein